LIADAKVLKRINAEGGGRKKVRGKFGCVLKGEIGDIYAQ
jgi:hypothetical protein